MVVPRTVRVAVYYRNSKDEQEDSVERQRSQVESYCVRMGFEIVAEYADEGMRGWRDDRPGFRRLLADAKAGRFSVIVVDEMSRLARKDAWDFVAEVAQPLRKLGIRLHTVAKGEQDWSGLIGLITTGVEADKTDSESQTLARRVLSEFAKRAKHGRTFVGKPAYGLAYAYRPKVDDSGRPVMRNGAQVNEPYMIVPGDPYEVEVVRWIFDAYDRRDMSLRQIALELQRRGVPTSRGQRRPAGKPVRWCASSVRKKLTIRAYVGDYVYNQHHHGRFARLTGGEVKTGRSPKSRNPVEDWFVIPDLFENPLITREQFNRVQAKLEDNTKRTCPKPDRGNHLLGRLLVCARCGGWMTGLTLRGARRYRCVSNLRFGPEVGCASYYVREQPLVNVIISKLEAAFLNPEWLAALRAEAARLQADRRDPAAETRLRQKVAKLDADIAKANRKLALVDDDMIGAVQGTIRDLRDERSKAQADLDALAADDPAGDLEASINALTANLWQLREAQAKGEVGPLRSLIRDLVSKVELHFETVRRGRRQFHHISRGVIHLKGLADLSTSPR